MNAFDYTTTMRVDADHPCFPGHFPGRPLVPGVLMLEHVAHALRCWRQQRVGRVVEAKFLAPLLPDEEAVIALEETGGRLRFEVRRGHTVLARGVLEAAA